MTASTPRLHGPRTTSLVAAWYGVAPDRLPSSDRVTTPVHSFTALAVTAVMAGAGCPGARTAMTERVLADGRIERTYAELSEPIANPERGLMRVIDVFDRGDIRWAAASGATLANAHVRLDEYRDRPLVASYLEDLEAGLDDVREAGLKLVLRFQYNAAPRAPDAPLSVVRQHLEQLAPLLARNADVIAVVQAGFLGAWGEGHSSTEGLDTPEARAAVLRGLLDALPAERMVQVRTPAYKEALFPGGPVDEAAAHDGSDRARVGHHNDCFLASDDDDGTYADEPARWKGYVAADGRFTVVGGETCRPNPPRTGCAAALAELRAHHWSYLNAAYHPDVVAGWKRGGCLDAIARDLGYRLVLRTARFPAAVMPGETLALELVIENTGYAAPYNPRPVYLVLGRGATRLALPLPALDPRRWHGGTRAVVTASVRIPAELPPGAYRLALWLPDPSPRLAPRPAYAIRFATRDVWDPDEGVNVLTESLRVGPAPAPGTRSARR
jgi:hypothetical protein